MESDNACTGKTNNGAKWLLKSNGYKEEREIEGTLGGFADG